MKSTGETSPDKDRRPVYLDKNLLTGNESSFL